MPNTLLKSPFMVLAILALAFFARQVLTLFRAYMPSSLILLLFLGFVTLGVLFFGRSNFFHFTPLRALGPIALAVSGALTTLFLEIPEERIHLFEYALLSFFVCTDLGARTKLPRLKLLCWAVFLTTMVGIVDELIQWALPYRVGDIRDVGINAVGAIWGAGLFVAWRRGQPGTPTQSEN